ncbi:MULTISPECIES: DUF485 domain-containing protein [unclassified Nocardioides]|uniref:DUF485 domain-containing protein n=1 Tax=unclassified Nocardioides TaxID=2615069 RepID=UPI0006F8DAE7|nr:MULTISPECIES: DUF485 domain-containing protein [unclassified Nocardioides]KQY62685.1 hypothetical protein ASD30_23545 [Nocardioides sp. Root140]KQZ75914.1 hypothetical protein ASD66_06320 [Nocardioides sp. Root151]KRF14986.1 hypothetical protein ASH02_12090 [Nocardioides sp. Soil796]
MTDAHGVHRRSQHPIYQELHDSAEFADLRRRYRSFVIPWTVAFLAWYLLYVIMSNWANDFMNTKLVGHINVALVFGLLQFASTFLIAWLYARHMNRNVDPVARQLEARYDAVIEGEGRPA